jgi:fructokinase
MAEPSRETERPVVVGIGEVLWDMLPAGKQLGGAPANFAYHAAALGAEGVVVSRVGDDAPGREILDRLDTLGLPRDHVGVDAAHATGAVDVHVADGGLPRYVIHEDAAWDFLPTTPALLALAARADVVCFGTLAQRSPMTRATVRAFLDAARPDCLRVFDINLRRHYHSPQLVRDALGRSDVLKLNDEELPTVAAMLGLPPADSDPQTLARIAGAAPSLKLIALTRGPHGSLLHTRGRTSDHPGVPPARIADTVGAGDAFTAAVVTGLLRGVDLDAINDFANHLASYVCTQSGATPPIPPELLTAGGVGG